MGAKPAAGHERLTEEALCAWPVLVAAYQAARRGKRGTPEVSAWFPDWEARLLRLRERLHAGYVFGPYRTFEVRDPKPRKVAAAPFADRVVHHAIVALVGPRFDRGMISSSFACRAGMGGRAAKGALLKECRSGSARYFAKCDVRRYFASVRHDVLLARLDRVSGDAWSRSLLSALIASWQGDEPGVGIPIGNLTSQLFANVYLNDVDHYMLRTARARGYMRYVDDMVWFGGDKDTLWRQLGALSERLAPLGLTLHPRKTRVGLVEDGVDFAGMVAAPRWLRLRGASKRRGLRHLAAFRRDFRRGDTPATAYLERMTSFAAIGAECGAYRLLAARGLRW